MDAGIPLDYLQGLDKCYQQFLTEMSSKGSHVIKVDWSHFGDAAAMKERIMDPHVTRPVWDHSFLRDIVTSPALIKSRMSVGCGHEEDLVDDWSDEEDLAASNHAELQTLAPASPNSPTDEYRG